ncbi:FCD domain-containing protein [Streptomyces sp. INA 01156]
MICGPVRCTPRRCWPSGSGLRDTGPRGHAATHPGGRGRGGAEPGVPGRGAGDRELAELTEVRALIEIPVVLRLSRTVPAERWAELRPLAEATIRAASSGCRATYAESDRAFHRAVLALAGNEQLLRIAEDLHRRAQWPRRAPPPAPGAARRGWWPTPTNTPPCWTR